MRRKKRKGKQQLPKNSGITLYFHFGFGILVCLLVSAVFGSSTAFFYEGYDAVHPTKRGGVVVDIVCRLPREGIAYWDNHVSLKFR